MIEYWERTTVTGYDGEKQHKEIVLHRRGEDPMVQAFRRNRELAGCGKIETDTREAFSREIREDRDERRRIPRSRNDEEEWDW